MSTATQTLKVPEVMERLQISRTTLHRITQPRGPLYAVRIGSSLRYPVEAVEAYIAGKRWGPEGGPEVQLDASTWPPTPSLFAPAERCAEEVSRAGHLEPCGRPASSTRSDPEQGTWHVCSAHSTVTGDSK